MAGSWRGISVSIITPANSIVRFLALVSSLWGGSAVAFMVDEDLGFHNKGHGIHRLIVILLVFIHIL